MCGGGLNLGIGPFLNVLSWNPLGSVGWSSCRRVGIIVLHGIPGRIIRTCASKGAQVGGYRLEEAGGLEELTHSTAAHINSAGLLSLSFSLMCARWVSTVLTLR